MPECGATRGPGAARARPGGLRSPRGPLAARSRSAAPGQHARTMTRSGRHDLLYGCQERAAVVEPPRDLRQMPHAVRGFWRHELRHRPATARDENRRTAERDAGDQLREPLLGLRDVERESLLLGHRQPPIPGPALITILTFFTSFF